MVSKEITMDMNNKELILAHEKKFAAILASHVLVKPKLSAWMIFIPFIFIFYFQDFSVYKKQRKEFLSNWFLSRKKALNEAEEAIDEGRKPNTQLLADQANLKAKVSGTYDRLLKVMANHYTLLLNAKGDSYEGLVRSAYGGRQGEYIFFINQLADAEIALNQALVPQLSKISEGVKTTIKKIEKGSEKLRRLEAGKIFESVK
ncbi:MAG: NF038143 family protein [Proteobacteria bacterium]|nr:NF038143 family protein [Pseudomonadota bacterium]MBU1695439.1 NF038143 family protein [Pseudomonadota bacterium]